MKKIICAILIICMSFGAFACADGFSRDAEAINESIPGVMLLAVYDRVNRLVASGSGFVAFSESHLITNWHVIENAKTVVAYTDAGETIMINKVLCVSQAYDVAILVFDEPVGVKPLPLSESEVMRGEAVVAIGSPLGFKNTVSIGNIASGDVDEETGYIQFTAPISSGSSGGALLNDNGEVVGITSATHTGEDTQNMNYAVEISYAIELFNQHRDDEPVELIDWKNVNYGEKEEYIPESREITIRDYAGFSISEIYLYPDNASAWGQARNTSGWLYKNESMTIKVTDEEAASGGTWSLNFCFYYNKRAYYMEYKGLKLTEILGRTVTIYMENGNSIRVEIE